MKRLSFWLLCLAFTPIWVGIFVNIFMLPDVRCSVPNPSIQEADGDHQGTVAEGRSVPAANAIRTGEVDWLSFDRNRGKQIRLVASTAAVLLCRSGIPQLTAADIVLWTDAAPADHSLIAQHVRLQL